MIPKRFPTLRLATQDIRLAHLVTTTFAFPSTAQIPAYILLRFSFWIIITRKTLYRAGQKFGNGHEINDFKM